MKISALEALDSFALLGPGYGGELSLMTALRADSRSPRLIYAAYESSGDAPLCYAAEHSPVEVDWEPIVPIAPLLDERGYIEAIEHIRASIAAGDVYQVNYSLRADIGPISGASLASILCRRGVPRYFAWVRFPEGDEFISASPECFFSIDGAQIRCEPMKGTAGPEREAWLTASEKDRAELSMITDLMRNDLMPVCHPGSVRVACERRFIRLPYAVQAVSDIEGRLLPGIGPREVLAALHPGGSITGAPKRAAMSAIAALEQAPRGPYCGSLGVVRGDQARFSILIRTAQKIADGWSYGVGGGIVWQSNPEDELREVHLKLGALR